MGVEDKFYSVEWGSMQKGHAHFGSVVLDGYSEKFLQGVLITAETRFQKHWVTGYTDLMEFMIEWKNFKSPASEAFTRFVKGISHTFASGQGLKSDLNVININDTCVFASPRVQKIWMEDLAVVNARDLREAVEAVWGLDLHFKYCVKQFPEFSMLFTEVKSVWQDAFERNNGIVIARC